MRLHNGARFLNLGRTNLWRGYLWTGMGAAAIAILLLAQYLPAGAQWDRSKLQQALLATVQVLVTDDNGDLYDSGSGTILDADNGLILTNFHVMGDPETGELFNRDGAAYIAVNPAGVRGLPVIKYTANIVKGNPETDLAVLRITGLADGSNAELPSNLGLVAAPRGDSEELLPGDRLAVIGFPGLGGSTVTFTEGVVSGFLDENRDGVYEWIKTDTEVNPGNSGGLAIDTQGEFVGVPTAGYSASDVAGKISLIRPGELALKFFDDAVVGADTSSSAEANASTTAPPASTTSSSDKGFGPIVFATDVDADGAPINAGNTFLDIKKIYAFFDVTGLPEGAKWQSQWLLDGNVILEKNQTWEGGDGNTWINISHPDGLPEGNYELVLSTEEGQSRSGVFTVASRGEQPNGGVNVTGIVHDADNSRKTISGAYVVILKSGVTVQDWIDAEFDDTMILASGDSVRGGHFQLDNRVIPGESYSVVVVHDNYTPVQADGYRIPEDASDPYTLDVPMERK